MYGGWGREYRHSWHVFCLERSSQKREEDNVTNTPWRAAQDRVATLLAQPVWRMCREEGWAQGGANRVATGLKVHECPLSMALRIHQAINLSSVIGYFVGGREGAELCDCADTS